MSFRFLLLAVLGFAFIGGTIVLINAGKQHLPKDDLLTRVFWEHKEAFEKVVTMVREDPDVEFVTVDEVACHLDKGPGEKWLPKKISDSRVDQYRGLLREIGIKDLVSIWPGRRPVMFYLYSDAFATKGICYWDKEPTVESAGTVFATLDDLTKLPQQEGHVRNGVYLRPIAGRWAVFLYWKD